MDLNDFLIFYQGELLNNILSITEIRESCSNGYPTITRLSIEYINNKGKYTTGCFDINDLYFKKKNSKK